MAFHPETRFYTLVMVDPGDHSGLEAPYTLLIKSLDVADVPNQSYKQFLHWVV